MILSIDDWIFNVDLDQTMEHSANCSHDHCLCGYCRNYYQTIDSGLEELRPFLAQFGSQPEAPVQLMPFEPTTYLAFFRIYGSVLRKGRDCLYVQDTPVMVRPEDSESFLLEVGELELPWVLDEAMEEVVSPANEPEFMEQMLKKWLERQPPQLMMS